MKKLPNLPLIAGICASVAILGTLALTFAPRMTGRSGRALPNSFTGSSSCRECHEAFYQKWATSHHGTSMRRFEQAYGQGEFSLPDSELTIEGKAYRIKVKRDAGQLIERSGDDVRTYPIQYVIGGKNVTFLLVELERGFLQTAPLAYNVHTRAWYDMAAAGIRHFGEGAPADSALSWKDRMYTFNTSCYGCHVSQLSTNYDAAGDTYATRWSEPGINCETCHGPGEEHIRVCKEAGKGKVPSDLAIISTTHFSADQINGMCASCHAKLVPITDSFVPGEDYFDHFGLTTLENVDFYPDGRDLGENYTYTSWRMAPCLKDTTFDCMHCHTSSGRYRFRGDSVNYGCMPCHQSNVQDPAAHTRHVTGSPAGQCVACHMPMTEFGRMRRSDHSMRPPMPSATIAFGSPNACNNCHTDRSAQWADSVVRDWRPRDFQAPVLYIGELVSQARGGQWGRLDEMLAYLRKPERDEIYATSLVRLLANCPAEAKWPALQHALQDRSPLIRSSAATALSGRLSPETVSALSRACSDKSRLVRINAAFSLAGITPQMLSGDSAWLAVSKATQEFVASIHNRQDNYVSHINLGNFHFNRQEFTKAIASFGTASRLRPDFVPPLVNAAMAHARLGDIGQAEPLLRRAVELEPSNAAANANLALLYGEQKRYREAEQAFRAAFSADSTMAMAAYNLAILVSADRPDEAVAWCRRAVRLAPERADYLYTLAFYQLKGGAHRDGQRTLQALIKQAPGYADAYLLLADSYRKSGQGSKAAALINAALQNAGIGEEDRQRLRRSLSQAGAGR